MAQDLWKVALGLVLGLAVIIYFNPPHTPCQAQLKLYEQAISPLNKQLGKEWAKCKSLTDQGGCLGFFDTAGKLDHKIEELPFQCRAELKNHDKTHAFVTGTLESFAKVAWGSKAPASSLQKNGWMDQTFLAQFCRLRRRLETIYGTDEWSALANRVLQSLPGAAEIGRNEAWARSILSDSCKY